MIIPKGSWVLRRRYHISQRCQTQALCLRHNIVVESDRLIAIRAFNVYSLTPACWDVDIHWEFPRRSTSYGDMFSWVKWAILIFEAATGDSTIGGISIIEERSPSIICNDGSHCIKSIGQWHHNLIWKSSWAVSGLGHDKIVVVLKVTCLVSAWHTYGFRPARQYNFVGCNPNREGVERTPPLKW